MSTFQIKDSVAFVTATNKPNGIGRGIVEALLAHGAKKVYATARDATMLDELVTKHSGKVVAVSLDVTDLDVVSKVSESYTDVTLLVNNAGYAAYTSSVGSVEEALKEIMVNYIGPMAVAKSFSSVFASFPKTTDDTTKPTAIVNINSIASLVNFPPAGTYSASKAASHSLTQAQRRDFPNSFVVGVYPGPVDTDMAEGMPFEKASVSSVANKIMDALQNGTEDLFPDTMSAELFEGWKSDYKQLEGAMAQQA